MCKYATNMIYFGCLYLKVLVNCDISTSIEWRDVTWEFLSIHSGQEIKFDG